MTPLQGAAAGGVDGRLGAGAWRTAELKMAHTALDQLRVQALRQSQRKELMRIRSSTHTRQAAELLTCRVREASLGCDRHGRRYWALSCSEGELLSCGARAARGFWDGGHRARRGGRRLTTAYMGDVYPVFLKLGWKHCVGNRRLHVMCPWKRSVSNAAFPM